MNEARKRLPSGVAEQWIIAALEAAKRRGVDDLGIAELQQETRLATATLHDTLKRLANTGKVKSFKVMNNDTRHLEVRVELPAGRAKFK